MASRTIGVSLCIEERRYRLEKQEDSDLYFNCIRTCLNRILCSN